MSHVQNKPNTLAAVESTWKPTAHLTALQARADLLSDIRAFFKERAVLEVETPLMCARGVTDLHLDAIQALYSAGRFEKPQTYYLQTSPEFAMKRLLAAGVGSIYQVCKAFRNGERGRLHNPEFTILEWYRLNFDHHQLMDEMELFLTRMLGTEPACRFSYRDLFLTYLSIDPHADSLDVLKRIAESSSIQISPAEAPALTRDDWLDLLMTHCIEPKLLGNRPFFVYDYPATQAALSKIRPGNPPLAERFEVYVQGVELANGYHELCDADLQAARFEEDNAKRIIQGLEPMLPDTRLLSALQQGLPGCAGVALGIDRLLMLKLNDHNIESALAFTIERA